MAKAVQKKSPSKKPAIKSKSTPAPQKRPPARVIIKKPVPAQQRIVTEVASVKPIPTPTPETPRYGWSNLPKGFPPHLKFLMQAAERECTAIENVPFSFAKFIHRLPQTVCGLQFGLMVLALELDTPAIGRLCGMPTETITDLLQKGSASLDEKFSEQCSDLDRKWSGYKKGQGRSIESVIEPYLIGKMDRNLQLLVGAVLLNRHRA